MTPAFATIPGTAPLRLVVVGAGVMGRHWMRIVSETPAAQLVGVVDLDTEAAAQAAAASGADVISGASLTAVAAETGADAVIDVTAPQAHRAVNVEALRAGLPVLCEKPIAPTVAETMALVAAAELTGQLLMTSQSRRYYPALARLKGMAATLGDIGIVTTEFFKAPHFGGFRDEMDDPLLVDMAIHAFDVARYLLGAEATSVDCRSFNPSWSWYRGDAAASADFAFDGGARYVYTGSWCSPGLETSWNGTWRISGENGTAAWDGEGEPVSDPAVVPADGPVTARSEIAGALDEFVRALRTGGIPSGEVHSNIHTIAMVEGAVRSARTGHRVALDGVLENAYTAALADERDADLRGVLASWGSAGDAVARLR
ncbi:oxidoreductase [Microbacterium mangrovi]|uniref:Oxidoreductase n=1 Tax=Microbacterium mangrovi TaxID=1348253 RepID=A0A0B1ZYX2_9MICO|nr:Gfo/Idh/MocA family oxidoreductase [Microbacterium mangrovi]KHK96420.1 oxidoreductase [Microbacterium mangrovi]